MGAQGVSARSTLGLAASFSAGFFLFFSDAMPKATKMQGKKEEVAKTKKAPALAKPKPDAKEELAAKENAPALAKPKSDAEAQSNLPSVTQSEPSPTDAVKPRQIKAP